MPNISDANTALLWALIEGNEDNAVVALKSGADVTMCSPTGSRPHHAAALRGSAPLIKILLKEPGIHVDETDSKGFTPLMVAALQGHSEVVKKLLDYGADASLTRSNGETALHLASNSRSRRVVTQLLQSGADVNAKTNKHKFTPLHYAAQFNNLPMTKVLLSHMGCDARERDANGHNAAEVARINDHHSLAQHLDLAISPRREQDQALIMAILESDEAGVRAALDDGADVNLCSLTGSRPLHAAALRGSVPLVRLLLEVRGVRMDQEDDEGYTPLMVAALNGHSEVVNYLLHCHADSTRTRTNGETALHLASNSSSHEVVNALLQNGADINAQTNDRKFTPLHYAAQFDNRLMTEILKKNSRCRKDEKDKEGRTPREVALHYGNYDVACLLGGSVDTSDAGRSRSALHLSPMSLRVVTGRPEPAAEDVYRCLSRPRGHVFIVNYENFWRNKDAYRRGSQQDVINLEHLFTKMGYKVFIHKDLDSEETLNALNNFSHDEGLEAVDAAVVCVLSHGKGPYTFLASDSQELRVKQVQNRFTNTNCPSLKGKPKLFLFNFCRGNQLEKGCILDHVKSDAVGLGRVELPEEGETMEAVRDSYTFFASVEGVMALRDLIEGTYFVQALTKILAQHAHNKHVEELGTRLHNHMITMLATTPDRQNLLAKKFYLNPRKGQ